MPLRALLTLAALFAAPLASAQTFASFDFADGLKPHRIVADDIEMVVTARKLAEPTEGAIAVTTVVRMPGHDAFTIAEDDPTSAVFTRQIGIGKLTATDTAPVILIQRYTGGAHCCAALDALIADGDTFRTVAIGTFDGEGTSAFPQDVDGDATADFVMKDDRFDYAFSSYAGSYAPPLILNLVDGKVVDVSKHEGFAHLFEQMAADARAQCMDKANEDRNGACAGYVAASARLGRFAPAFREAAANAAPHGGFLPSHCTVAEVAGACPPGKTITFRDFAEALRWFLSDAGYIAS